MSIGPRKTKPRMEISNGKEAHLTVEYPPKQIHRRATAMICAQSIRTRTRLREDAASNPTLRVAVSSNPAVHRTLRNKAAQRR
jgi:hypothetical protein